MKNISQNEKRFGESALPDSYTSRIIEQFLHLLDERCANPQILDVGPVCSENIMFFGHHVKKIYVCDLYYRLHLSRLGQLKPEQLWKSLDYPEQVFDGILLWDLIDRMDQLEFQQFAAFCLKCIKPGGLIYLTAFGKQTGMSNVNTFVVGQDFQISYRLQKHLDLSMKHRHNREIVTTFSPLSLAKAQINKNGFREFLLQMESH